MQPQVGANPQGDCPYRIGLVVDLAGPPDKPMAALAERSADTHYRRIPGFAHKSGPQQ